jgi:hypothetical protein
MALAFTDGMDRYGATADLDLIYTRNGNSWQSTAGVNGGGAIRCPGATTCKLSQTSQLVPLTSGGTVHAAFWHKQTGGIAGTTNRIFNFGTDVQNSDSGSAPHLGFNPNNGSVYVTMHGATTQVATSAAGVIIAGQYQHIELRAKWADSGGIWQVWVDRVQVINFSGDTLSGTQPTEVRQFRMEGGGNITQADFDDVIVWDEAGTDFVPTQLADYHVIEALATSADDSVQFTPLSSTNESNVDETGFHDGDTTYNQSTTVGHVDTFAMADQASTPSSCMAIAVHTVAKKTDVGGVTMRNRIKHGSTTAEGADKTLTTSYAKYSDYFGKNPDTSAAWGNTDVNSLIAGYEYQA